MIEEEKKEETPLPTLEHPPEPTRSLIQPKPTRKYTRRNKFNIQNILPDPPGTAPVGFQNWTHERSCHRCSAVIRVALSQFPRGTIGADFEVRSAAIGDGWDVRLRISGHLQYACPRCRLKAA
jgi:hypothetical protein